MIRVEATEDGTYTVYRDHIALTCGLTDAQADALVRSLGQEAA